MAVLTTADLPESFRYDPDAVPEPVRRAVVRERLTVECEHGGCVPCLLAATRRVLAEAAAQAALL